MAITNCEIQMALRIKRCVKEFFDTHNQTEVAAKELMPLFIKADIFKANHQDGLPIRDFLRHLEKEKYLNLIPQALYKQKSTNKNWYFIKPFTDVRFQ
jgi:hypothetical protein